MESSDTKLAETSEKVPSVTSVSEKDSLMIANQEKGRLTPNEVIDDSAPDEKVTDHIVNEGSKENEDTHSDPETGELDDSFPSSIKEPNTDLIDMVPSMENVLENDSNFEVRAHYP